MKLRHAVALALVGWYLVLPPIDYGGSKIMATAPLRDWERYQSFEAAKECNEFLASYIRNVAAAAFERADPEEDARKDRQSNWPIGTTARNRSTALDRARRGICIASDDPRLKEK